MNVLDTIDTTVTFEWLNTRTIGSLVRLEGRGATVTALRAPEAGTSVYLRLEGESQADGIALDGVCASVTDSEWGERLVEIEVQRVGTTASATVLRDFIETHNIARGGSVSVGRHRDDPNLKRFVYTLPEEGAERHLGGPATGESAAYAATVFATPRPRPGNGGEEFGLPDTQEATDPAIAADLTPPAPLEMPASLRFGGAQRPPEPKPAPAPLANPWAPPAPAPVDISVPSDTSATQPMAIRTASSFDDKLSREADFAAATARAFAFGLDEEPILVNTVQPDLAYADPVLSAPPTPAAQPAATQAKANKESSLLGRLLGGLRRRDSRAQAPTAAGADEATSPTAAAPIPDLDSQQDGHALASPVGTRKGGLSGSITAVQALFATDQAIRVEIPVEFESGKKKRTGVLLRLSESKLRIRSAHQPEVYERMTVTLTGSRGPKDTVILKCEVTRSRLADGEGGESAFDTKLTGGNPPGVMAKLRALIAQSAASETEAG